MISLGIKRGLALDTGPSGCNYVTDVLTVVWWTDREGDKAMKSRAVLAAGVFALVLGGASAAWACTYLPTVIGLSSTSAPSGSTVEVFGQGVGLAGEPVELRWNSVEGPIVATTLSTAGDNRTEFAATMTVPDVAPGVYVVLAMDPTGQTTEPTRTTFQVTPSVGAANLASEQAASLTQPASYNAPAPTDNSNLGLVAGLGLLGFGTAALLAGFAVTISTRRSRVPVSRERSTL